MATPLEVLELAIPHPADSTPQSRKAAANQCIQALQVNDFYFVRRQTPVLDHDDGQCPHCKCELVHVMQDSPSFENAEALIQHQRHRIERLETRIKEAGLSPY